MHCRDAGGAEREALGDRVLEVTRRCPNLNGLGLEHTSVRFDHRGVKVGDSLETGEPGIYAAGDVVGHPLFAHWATAQGLALAGHLLGRPSRFPSPARNSAVIFSTPELGIAGLTESEARAAGHEIAAVGYDYRADPRAQVSGQTEGMLKLVYDKTSRAVLGVHIFVEGAASLPGEGALAVGLQAPIDVISAARLISLVATPYHQRGRRRSRAQSYDEACARQWVGADRGEVIECR